MRKSPARNHASASVRTVRKPFPKSGGLEQYNVLTARQTQCLRLVRDGQSTSRISQKLHLSADTVNEHIAKACRRLRVRTRTQAVLVASLQGLL